MFKKMLMSESDSHNSKDTSKPDSQKMTLEKTRSPMVIRRIPLKHLKNLTKIQVTIKNEYKLNLFELNGEFPAFVCSIKSDDERIRNVDIKVGDYIFEINNQNVSRASAKSVRRIIKSSNELFLTLCRPSNGYVNTKMLNSVQSKSTKTSPFGLKNASQTCRRNLVKLFKTEKNKTTNSSTQQIKSLMSCIKPFEKFKPTKPFISQQDKSIDKENMVKEDSQQETSSDIDSIERAVSNSNIHLTDQKWTQFDSNENLHKMCSFSNIIAANEKSEQETVDFGYYSIPRTDYDENSNNVISSSASTITSLTSISITTTKFSSKKSILLSNSTETSSSRCLKLSNHLDDINKTLPRDSTDVDNYIYNLKNEIQEFLSEVQYGIEAYVRPSIVLSILSQQECLDLYQNVEKLIPVTKFMLNIFNSFELNRENFPKAESLKLVFDSFKTYFNGLPKALSLLSHLSSNNNKFILFLEKMNDHDSLKIFDFIFMPLSFVCQLIECVKNLEKYSNLNSNDSCSDNKHKLGQIIDELYELSVEIQEILQEDFDNETNQSKFESNESQIDQQTNMNLSTPNTIDSDSCSNSTQQIYESWDMKYSRNLTIPVEIKGINQIRTWKKGFLNFDQNRLKIQFDESNHSIKILMQQIQKAFISNKNCNVVNLDLTNSNIANTSCLSFKFHSQNEAEFFSEFLNKNFC